MRASRRHYDPLRGMIGVEKIRLPLCNGLDAKKSPKTAKLLGLVVIPFHIVNARELLNFKPR